MSVGSERPSGTVWVKRILPNEQHSDVFPVHFDENQYLHDLKVLLMSKFEYRGQVDIVCMKAGGVNLESFLKINNLDVSIGSGNNPILINLPEVSTDIAPEKVSVEFRSQVNKLINFVMDADSTDFDIGNTSKYNRHFSVYDAKKALIPLVGRKEQLSSIFSSWNACKTSYSEIYRPPDRTQYPVPVCFGLPGVGKSRMLDEWESVFDEMKIDKDARVGIVTSYGNGTGPVDIERDMSVATSLSYRLLYEYFFRQSPSIDYNNFMKYMWKKYGETGLELSINAIIRHRRTQIDEEHRDKPISVFIGIDEFQMIKNSDNITCDIEKLIQSYITASTHASKIDVYMMWAGTEWSKLPVAGSGFYGVAKKIGLSVLEMNE